MVVVTSKFIAPLCGHTACSFINAPQQQSSVTGYSAPLVTDSRTPAPTIFLVLQTNTGDVHPALQVHGPPFGPVDPVLQVQFVKAELPAGELELVGHSVHVEVDGTLQEATNPEATDPSTLPSDVNTTCMYPVLDV